jgi:hypothetical protein
MAENIITSQLLHYSCQWSIYNIFRLLQFTYQWGTYNVSQLLHYTSQWRICNIFVTVHLSVSDLYAWYLKQTHVIQCTEITNFDLVSWNSCRWVHCGTWTWVEKPETSGHWNARIQCTACGQQDALRAQQSHLVCGWNTLTTFLVPFLYVKALWARGNSSEITQFLVIISTNCRG